MSLPRDAKGRLLPRTKDGPTPDAIEDTLRRQQAQTCTSAKISTSPRSIIGALWPVWYPVGFVGACVTIGVGIVISAETVQFLLPIGDSIRHLLEASP